MTAFQKKGRHAFACRPVTQVWLRLLRLFHWLRSFVRRDPQRSKEAAIVCGHFKTSARLHDTSWRSHFGERRRLLRATNESDDGFERHLHLEPRRARFLTAGLNLRVF